MELSQILPWGRSLLEYQLMFQLTEVDLSKKILGCGDGPASFNSEMKALSRRVVSCDPIYRFSSEQISAQFESSLNIVLSQVQNNLQDYVWTFHRSPAELAKNRKEVLRRFVKDFDAGLREGRYVVAELPVLPFRDLEFDIALCSHLLFLYSSLLDLEFHCRSIFELCRVAREVRIFPLVGLDCEKSPFLAAVLEKLSAAGYSVAIAKSAYQLQRGGDSYLRITR